MRTKYPPIEPYRTDFLEVEKHRLYFEESGNPQGTPVLFLHGGPGGGCEAGHRSFFDPKSYRIVLFDQRGAGKSTPHASLEENTTWHLVADIERLREKLGIERWVVFGGSWGSTLALTYAVTHPGRVRALILRGIFLGRKKELDWSFQEGANFLYPDMWEEFLEPIPEGERGDLLHAYHRRLNSNDSEVRKKAAKHWASWEGAILRLLFDRALFSEFSADFHADALARIECHYFVHQCFFPSDDFLLKEVAKIRGRIPAWIIHGRYDVVCPLESAWALHRAWPEAHFEIIPDAGHASSEPGILDALIRATDHFRGAL